MQNLTLAEKNAQIRRYEDICHELARGYKFLKTVITHNLIVEIWTNTSHLLNANLFHIKETYYFDSHYGWKQFMNQCMQLTEIETNKGLDSIYNEIQLSDFSRWNKTLLKKGMKPIEISSSVYNHMLNCLPPRNWVSGYFEVGEADHHNDEGRAVHRAFFKTEGKYYTGYPWNIPRRRGKR